MLIDQLSQKGKGFSFDYVRLGAAFWDGGPVLETAK